jgi:hypothetical protein
MYQQTSLETLVGLRADGKPETNKAKLRAWLDDLEKQHFYGTVACKFEHGHVTYVRVEQGFKPQDLSETPRNHASNSQYQ